MDTNEVIECLRKLTLNRKRRRIWQPFMEKYDCQIICEIGVREGINFVNMIAHNPRVAVAVDAWTEDGNPAHNDSGYPMEHQELLYQRFSQSLADKPCVQIYREYSYDAVKRFPDEYFDLVYIDADHTYEGCKRDIEDWYHKVKTGMFLIGDDYSIQKAPLTGVKFGVIPAVDEFAKNHGYQVHEITEHGWVIIK